MSAADARWRTHSHSQAVLAILLSIAICGFGPLPCAGRTSDVLKVQLSHGGVLVGRHLTSLKGRHVRAFLGVPFAQPPLGELRFKHPRPYGAWSGEMLAVEDSALCTQRDPYRRDMEIIGSEDCLYLNVYTPETPNVKGPLPTMVWFHGGGWQCGSGIRGFYGPDFLMDRDVVLVSANFRLGPLGFLSTETVDCPGNFGLKDQLEVLKWVQKNIAAFGGNPHSVTIFGESAGGASVTYHMMSEKSKGLFHRGIAQSGTYFNPWAQPAHKGTPAARARKMAELVGCDPNTPWPQMLKCLRQKDHKDIVATIYDLFEWDYDPMIPFPPVVEPEHNDAFLTAPPRAMKRPHGFSLPLMIGPTSEEGLLKTAALLNEPGLLDEFKRKFHDVLPIILNYDHHPPHEQQRLTQQIEEFYFKNGHNYNKRDHHNLTNLITDGWFIAGIDEYLRLRLTARQQTPSEVGDTFVYFFDHKGSASFTEIFKGGSEDHYGSCHAEELQYLFPVGQALFVTASPSKRDIELRELMLTLWTNFANTSNPTPGGSLPGYDWQPTQTYPVKFVHIGNSDDGEPLMRTAEGLLPDRTEFWHNLKPHIPAGTAWKDEL